MNDIRELMAMDFMLAEEKIFIELILYKLILLEYNTEEIEF